MNSTDRGISITDGIHTGKFIDTVFNRMPIQLEGLRTLTVKKSEEGDLVFESVDNKGIVFTHKVGSQ
jgi:plasmid rolling circle replication initiator protein Rep